MGLGDPRCSSKLEEKLDFELEGGKKKKKKSFFFFFNLRGFFIWHPIGFVMLICGIWPWELDVVKEVFGS